MLSMQKALKKDIGGATLDDSQLNNIVAYKNRRSKPTDQSETEKNKKL